MPKNSSNKKLEFGDFQTPNELAQQIVEFLQAQGLQPASVLEPTCGEGSLLLAALSFFPSLKNAIGLDINSEHLQILRRSLEQINSALDVTIIHADIFGVDRMGLFKQLQEPILVLGNPPWVTNAEITILAGNNLPSKANFQKFSGLDALTGKSNFDISEWILIHLLEQCKGHEVTLAMLCKTSVARRTLAYAWKNRVEPSQARIYRIDAAKNFGAAVDACLLVCTYQNNNSSQSCRVYTALDEDAYQFTFGLAGNRLIADLDLYQRWRHLQGNPLYKWRSGIKHDCASVMEFSKHQNSYCNGLGELIVDLESDYFFPLLKSSDIANAPKPIPSRWMLVPQTALGQDTHSICYTAPRTWRYLEAHAHLLNQRKSNIYKKQPPFAIFGVGDYSFAMWKVAISGLYKKLHFAVVSPFANKPVVLDDTCNFIPCRHQNEAELLAMLLNSDIANQFLSSFIFWDTKRPITTDILNQLDLVALATELGLLENLNQLYSTSVLEIQKGRQLALFT